MKPALVEKNVLIVKTACERMKEAVK